METAISLIGGLGLFLYGMNVMGDGLQKSAGSKLKSIIEMLTSNAFIGVLVGAGVTAIIQSSSATTVMVVGFVNAGIMSIFQAIGVIMGANIGTTITAQLVSFNLEGIAPLAVGIGVIALLFTKNAKLKNVAEIIIGFGILFIGMQFMKESVAPLAKLPEMRNAMLYFSKNPLLGVFAGFAITGIVQSSSASMGMLIALSSLGLVPITAALPILYGDNIGTCVTSLLSSIGASRNAKRAAIMHMTFNIMGTILFILILNKPIVALVTKLDPTDVSRQIANSHTLFNLVNVCILLPFHKLIVKLSMKIIPYNEEEEEADMNTKFLDERILETPSIALANTFDEVVRMGTKAEKTFKYTLESIKDNDPRKNKKAYDMEKTVNKLQRDITNFLMKLSTKSLDENEKIATDMLFHIVNNIERFSDHADNINEISEHIKDAKIDFSKTARQELWVMTDLVVKNFELAISCIKDYSVDKKIEILKIEKDVNQLDKTYRDTHIQRLNNQLCSVEAGVLFIEILGNLERMSDHSQNIMHRSEEMYRSRKGIKN